MDTDRCSGCGDCIAACPAHILELADNEFDPLAQGQIAMVKPAHRKTIKYDCGPCKPASGARALPCVTACKPGALTHSW
ncbi:MAG: 4Fe-4S dicluster domain-containing protein [Chloroflexi bacterium]|nr:4Fe-4S dicluster domain-containing protein [Chloroflexota bacterium]